ncbi:hypothetical protein [Lentzea jiangxiensis]|uniref:DUF4064 domain-containing protein n=1 Tax=Lentzea jiangxiensis TaxID=641025 RepID=A0A1H0DTB8_9PSEU|nr:hypothetical protein [Lentzea jiangxiensis]SDN73286.1 hypothetical protein SAMN05421507_101107 [Lentzea jiangxiensis]
MKSPKEPGTPGAITAGYWLVVAGSALGVLSALYMAFNTDLLVDAAVRANRDPKITRDMLVSSTTVVVVVSLVVTVVLAGLAVWFAGKVRSGLKKSRTGLMITLLIGLFFQMITNVLGVVTALVAVSGLVLFYFRQSSDHLTEREQAA